MDHSSFIMNYRSVNEQELESNPQLFHLLGRDFESVQASFGRMGEFYNLDEPFERSIPGRKITATTEGQNYMYVAPSFYEGTIYRVDLQEGYQISTLEGHNPPYPSYVLLDSKKMMSRIDGSKPYEGMGPNIYAFSAQGESYFAQSQKWSSGLFVLSDGRLAHFTRMGEGDYGRTYGIEVFSNDGTYEGYFPIRGYETSEENPLIMRPLFVDGKDQLYITDNMTGYFVVRVVNLRFH